MGNNLIKKGKFEYEATIRIHSKKRNTKNYLQLTGKTPQDIKEQVTWWQDTHIKDLVNVELCKDMG